MAFITNFAIEGLAGRTDSYSCTLNRDVNVFFGANGGGKTSLLKILTSALANDAKNLGTVAFESATVNVFSVDYDTTIQLRLRRPTPEELLIPESALNEHLRAQLAERAVTKFVTSTGEVMYARPAPEPVWVETPRVRRGEKPRLRHTFLPTSRLYANAFRAARYRAHDDYVDDELLNSHFQELLQSHWSALYGEVQNNVQIAQRRGLVAMLKEVLSAKQPKTVEPALGWQASFERVERFMRRQDAEARLGSPNAFHRRFQEDPLLRRVVAHVEEVETEIELALRPATKLQELLNRIFSRDKTVRMSQGGIEIVNRNERRIGLASLSSGEKHVLRILVESIRAQGGPFIIDEPELSLHIDWQRELIAMIREINSDSQIIVATHSPEIMANIDDSQIFAL